MSDVAQQAIFAEMHESRGGAVISSCGVYRYTLKRRVGDSDRSVAFLMFNPSTADAEVNDATIRKCIGFARRWGYGTLQVVNLYAVRSRDPKAVARMGSSAVGPLNNFWIKQVAEDMNEVVCAWGCAQHAPAIGERIQAVLDLLDDPACCPLVSCLGYRKDGHPRHPLMLGYETRREPFVWREA